MPFTLILANRGEADAVVGLAERADGFRTAGFLATELVAGKTGEDETRVLEFLIQRFAAGVLRLKPQVLTVFTISNTSPR